jgi:hypothetical protein
MGNYFSGFNQQLNNPIDKNNKINEINNFNRYKNESLHINNFTNKIYIPKLPPIKE